MPALPNLIYIGPDKAGSTWLFGVLSRHPDVFVTPAKDLYFFDRYFQKGVAWYRRQFAGSDGHSVVCDISHDYLYSRPAAERIREVLPQARLMVCLREPCQRTFSGYLHLVKSGQFAGSFPEALEAFPGLISRSLYGRHLAMYLQFFPRERIHVACFDDLQRDPQEFADRLFATLQLPPLPLEADLREQSLPAGRSRSVWLTRTVKLCADGVRAAGLPGLVGRIKTARCVQHLLFRPYGGQDKPRPSPEIVRQLRSVFGPDLELLDRELKTDFRRRWQYDALPDVSLPAAHAPGKGCREESTIVELGSSPTP
jgi:hypothetical protein